MGKTALLEIQNGSLFNKGRFRIILYFQTNIFYSYRDSKLEIVESSRNKLTQDESNGEFSYADEEATDFQLTSNIIYHQGESASDYI